MQRAICAKRTRAGPEKFLEGYRGYLHADAYAGYDAFFTNPRRGLTEVVPKRALVSNLHLSLQNRKLAISKSLPLSQALRKELAAAKPDAHTGDLAMALALAAWQTGKPP